METVVTTIIVAIILLICFAVTKDEREARQKEIDESKNTANRSSSYSSNTHYQTRITYDENGKMHFDNSDFYTATNKENKKSGTKDIVTGAVIGGIVAGPAGAVVGAIVGKDKADKKNE